MKEEHWLAIEEGEQKGTAQKRERIKMSEKREGKENDFSPYLRGPRWDHLG